MDSLGILELHGWSAAMVILDVAAKASSIRLLHVEHNDLFGVCIKLDGDTASIEAALAAARSIAARMHIELIADAINAPHADAGLAWQARPDFNPLIEQDTTRFPRDADRTELKMADQASFAIGMIETQGLTAVIEAIDTACKAANVEVIGREKLGGGYITVLIKGDVAAVQAAVDAGKAKVEGLGKLIAAHVIARPSLAVLSLLPK